MRLRWMLAVGLLVATFTCCARAQEAGQRWMISEDFVKPAMAEQYESLVHEFVSLLKQNNVNSPMFTGYTFQSTDFCYITATPMGNWSDLDKMNSEMPEVEQKLGKKRLDELTQRMGATIDHSAFLSARELPELSYHPPKNTVNRNERYFVHYDLFYIAPGRYDDAIQVAKEWKKIYEAKQIPEGFTVFSVGFGGDLPLIIMERTAKTMSDYVAQMDQETRTFAESQKQLAQRWNEIIRRYESRNAYYRPDLSYPANQPASLNQATPSPTK